MIKSNPDEKKKTARTIRIVLVLLSITAIITGLCLLSGDMWRVTPYYDSINAKAGDIVGLIIYSPSKFFFALLYAFIVPLVWLLLIRTIHSRILQSSISPLLLFILAVIFIFLHPEITPGRDAGYQYSRHNIYHTSISWRKEKPGHYLNHQSKYETYLQAKDPDGYMERNNIKSAWSCETQRYSMFFTLSIYESWFPDGDARVLEAQCRKITDIHMLSEETLLVAKWNMKNE
ncbi:glycosyl transferase [Klebsiella grimontii]|uniref:glycosyl transferase n=1 Tax=Klebsiella grimontii TaxID=2058152 RepID=UPI00186901BD|nr:glycosyl transferase [Klebsiella grimontii]